MDLFLSNSWESKLINHFVTYTQLTSYVNIHILSQQTLELNKAGRISIFVPCLVVDENTYLTSPVSICLHLAKLSGTRQFLFGNSTQEETQVISIVENAQTSENVIEDFNKELASKTFLQQGHITFSDLFVFFKSYNNVLGLSNDQKWQYCHFFRWFYHIQSLQGIAEFLEKQNMPQVNFPTKQTANLNQKSEQKQNKKEKVVGSKAPVVDEEKQKLKKEQQLKNQQKLQQQQKEQKAKKTQAAQQPAQQQQFEPTDPLYFEQNIDIRVGELKKVWKHPESDKLWCEQIDCGEGELREIASGLQQIIPLEQMTGLVCVFANLKARKLAGFSSNGMVLCSSTSDKSATAILRPPEGSKPGDRITLAGLQDKFRQEKLPLINPKHKILETALPHFKCDENGVANYNGHNFSVGNGVCSSSIKNGIVA